VPPSYLGLAGMHEVRLLAPYRRSCAALRYLGASMRHRRPESISEFVSFLVREGHVETVMIEHVPTRSGHCRRCGNPWPCYWRKLAAAALPLTYRHKQ
jgi:hypothetical protein